MDFNPKEIESDRFILKNPNDIEFFILINFFDLLIDFFDLLINSFNLLIDIFRYFNQKDINDE